jgi:phage terminase small subunit
MTIRQKRFAECYAKGYSASEAAVLAGYSSISAASNAYKLLKNQEVVNHIHDIGTRNYELVMQQHDMCTLSMERLLADPSISQTQRLKAQSQIIQLAKVLVRPQSRLSSTLLHFSEEEDDTTVPEPDPIP